jgi:glutamate synthase domain-containing protein 2
MDEEREANSRYLLELASARFGWRRELLDEVRAFHFKGGQAAKTGTGGHLPGSKVTDKIAETRGIEAGKDAVSPATFEDLRSVKDFRSFADEVRERSGGIPVGFKLSANHVEDDIDFALDAGADYIILDGRGGGTGAAPAIFRDHISVPTIPALARARRHMDKRCGRDVTLIVTGGLRTPEDFVKALALGADGIALANSAIQAIGCVAARMCHTNRCPSGVATQDPALRKRLKVDDGAERLARFFGASVELMSVLARACGHSSLGGFAASDLTTFKRDMAALSGIAFGGVGEAR